MHTAPLQTFCLTIAYDGTQYHGWQRQNGVATVQAEVEQAAGRILNQPVGIHGASRTDTGVHAWGQLARMEAYTTLDPLRMRRAINSRLPGDILVRDITPQPLGFDVHPARRKRYRYLIWNSPDRPMFNRAYCYHYYRPLDIARMQAACRHFEGTHDYIAFRGCQDHRPNTTRTIYDCSIHRRGPLVMFSVIGSGFMYHMVRTMVGTVLEIGRGHWEPERIDAIIASQDRQQAGPTAPPQGLCLQWIELGTPDDAQTADAGEE
jgi:tRNA pseudouridine38-40 synthase